MKGHQRYRSGAWRLVVAAGTDPVTGRRRSIYATVSAPNTRAGSKLADARLAELVAAVESGHDAEPRGPRRGPLVNELAQAWQQSNRPRRDPRSGDCDEAPALLNDQRLSKDMQAAMAASPDVVAEGLPGPAFARSAGRLGHPGHGRPMAARCLSSTGGQEVAASNPASPPDTASPTELQVKGTFF
jgi:hypothetical protein